MGELPAWILNPRKQDFFIQERPKDPWHCETEEDCELMLCGRRISVNGTYRVSNSWGPLKCPDCWMVRERMRRVVFQ